MLESSKQLARALFCALLLGPALGCAPPLDEGGPVDAGGASDGGTGYPPPRDDLVLSVGSAETLDVVTWNLENFPATSSTTGTVADLITSLDVDLVAVQEVADTRAFEELAQRLPLHAPLLSSHAYSDGSYQKVGFLYREDLLTPSDVRLLFPSSGYEFPRPPMQVSFTYGDGEHPPFDFIIISLHLKAGRTREDAQRRADAMAMLEAHVRSLVDGRADDEVLLVGDFNDVLDEANGREVFGPFLASPERYRVHTEVLSDQGASTFLPSARLYDHILSTAALDDERQGRAAVIPRLETQVAGYQSLVSDHLPVALSLPVWP